MYVIKRKRICLILIALLLGIFVYSYEETKINTTIAKPGLNLELKLYPF